MDASRGIQGHAVSPELVVRLFSPGAGGREGHLGGVEA